MMKGQVAARGDNVSQGQMSLPKGAGCSRQIVPEAAEDTCVGEGLSGKRFLIDRGAYAGQRGEGRNHLAHPGEGEELPRGAGALL